MFFFISILKIDFILDLFVCQTPKWFQKIE
uniref:Uncharacterized protein n=1 Tax=viral metagenome TaxID=1070528 RepID=A0A6C0DMU7_9ZZZZ